MKNSVVFVGVLAAASSAFAQTNHGNFAGTNFNYINVTEAVTHLNQTGPLAAPATVFNAPTITGDALNFNNLNFGSSSSGAGGLDFLDGNLSFLVNANSVANPITDISFSERGDYRFLGTGTATGTTASVSLTIFIQILAINGSGITPINIPVVQGTFNPSSGSYDIVNDPTGPLNQPWTGGASISIANYMAANNIAGVATSIRVSLDNTLTTTSEAGTISFIRKKEFGGLTVTVPTPGTAALGAVAMGFAARRRRA